MNVTLRFIAAVGAAVGSLHGFEWTGAAHGQQFRSDAPRLEHGADDLGSSRAEGQVRRFVAVGIRVAGNHHADRETKTVRHAHQLAELVGNSIQRGVLAPCGPVRI